MSKVVLLVCLFTCCPWVARTQSSPSNPTAIEVGEYREFVLSDGRVEFVFRFNKTAEGRSPALRLVMSSENSSTLHPLLVTVRQNRGVDSWMIPHIESGYTFPSVERTLCPFLNTNPEQPMKSLQVELDVSTSSPTNITFSLNSSFVEGFYHSMNRTASLTAAPSSPAYIFFEHPEEHSRVQVRFSSQDNTSSVCAIASIQKTYCPVVELLDNPDHRGIFQTMRSKAAINIELVTVSNGTDIITDRQQTQFEFFYIVVSVFPSNDSCLSAGLATTSRVITLDLADNFNPEPYTGPDLTKNVLITIEPALPDWVYVVSTLIPVFFYFSLYFISLGWIIYADWFRHSSHPLEKLIIERRQLLDEYFRNQEPSENERIDLSDSQPLQQPDPELGLTATALEAARQQSATMNQEISLEEVDTSETAPNLTTHDSTHSSSSPTHHNNFDPFHSSPARIESPDGTESGQKLLSKFWSWSLWRQRYDSTGAASPSSNTRTKRPSLGNVLLGTQYSSSISKVPPLTPHYPNYLHRSSHHSISPRRSPHSRRSSSFHGFASHGHHRSAPTAAATSIGPASTRTASYSSAGQESPASGHSKFSPSISTSAMLGMQQKRRGQRREGTDSVDFTSPLRQQSYLRAIDAAEEEIREEEMKLREEVREEVKADDNTRKDIPPPEEDDSIYEEMGLFAADLQLCDLPEFDETSKVQKQYNRLSWYLIAIIIFYAIPAYQLVLTYQQLLTLSGNQDVCYYNNLCSHPWRVNNFMTISSFNNVFSNIGYVSLGFLYILIAYRRRRMYHAVEEVVNNPFITNRETRIGVPQHFGVYYAIGFALMAEGFMSAAYHICPGKTNYQFDTTLMFVLTGLGIFKLLETRSPDLRPGLHKILVLFAAIIVMVVVGVLASSLTFYILFFFVYVVATFIVTVETYYRWQIKLSIKSVRQFYNHITSVKLCPPNHKPRFMITVLSNVLNWLVALYAVIFQPVEFGTFFLFVLLFNFILLLLYYIATKFMSKELPSFRPVVFLILCLLFWIAGIYFYLQAVTNWLESPAVSRDGNRDCVAHFYDSHDMWHFLSAFALFFSFLMLMTLDDDTEGTPRTHLRVF